MSLKKLARKAAGRLEVGSTKLYTALFELTGKLEADRASKVKEQGQAEKPGMWKMTAERRAAAAVASLKYGCASGVAVAGILGRCSLADGLGVRGRRPSEKLLSPQADVRNRMHHQCKLLSARVKLQIAEKLNLKINKLGQLRQSRIAVWVELHGLRNAQYLSGLRSVISVEHYQKSKLEDLQKAVGKHHPLK